MGKSRISVSLLERVARHTGVPHGRTRTPKLSPADQEAPLEVDDLQCLAMAAYLTGRGGTAIEVWGRAHHGLLTQGTVGLPRAVRCAFWAGVALIGRGQHAQAGAAAYVLFTDVAAIGDRFDDPDLMALGRLGRGQALVATGQAGSGVAMLDEAMVAVIAGEVSARARRHARRSFRG